MATTNRERRTERKEEAVDRGEKRTNRTAKEQLTLLDQRLGAKTNCQPDNARGRQNRPYI